jgi:hypothetical protein
VTAVEVAGAYYDEAAYQGRSDRIYVRVDDDRLRIHADAGHHQDGTHLENDVGVYPGYERARVLLSDDFRYFGSDGESATVDLAPYPTVRARVRALRQGHLVHHSPVIENELRELQRSAWSGYVLKVEGAPGTSHRCTTAERTERPPARRTCG